MLSTWFLWGRNANTPGLRALKRTSLLEWHVTPLRLEFVLKCSVETLGGRQSEIKPRWKNAGSLQERKINRQRCFVWLSTSVVCLKTSKQESRKFEETMHVDYDSLWGWWGI